MMRNSFRSIFAILAGLVAGYACGGTIIKDEKIVTSYIGRNVVMEATISDIPE